MSDVAAEHGSWLTPLPSRWRELRLKYIASCNDEVLQETTPEAKEIEYVDIGSVSSTGDIVSTETILFVDAPSRARRIVRQGDVLVSTVRTYLKAIAPVRNAPKNLIASTGFAVIRSGSGAVSDYLAYALRAEGFIGEVISRSVGISYPAINASDLVNICIPAPPMGEQTQIARFLDYETAKIDALIEKQQQLIALLKEKRQAVISHAVTKGLNPDAPLRDSGVEWLGEVPAHWTVCKVKQVAELESGHTPSRKVDEYWQDCEIPWVSLNDTGQLKIVDYIAETAVCINEKGMANSSAHELPAGCGVFTRDASIGLAAITARVMAVSQHIIAWVCDPMKVTSEYLLLVFYAMEAELERFTFGATLKTIGMPDVKRLTGAFPPLEEQAHIVEQIFSSREALSASTRKSEEMLEILAERRTALISAAVTGKIDVRNWQSPDDE